MTLNSISKTSQPSSGKKPVGKIQQPFIEVSAKLTSKHQTTIPNPVRAALGLEAMDRIRFVISREGRVELTKDVTEESEDPMVSAFLDFIETDIVTNPQMLTILQRDKELAKLLKNVELDENFT